MGEPPFDPYKLPPDDPEYHLKRNVRAARYPTTETSAWNELSDDAKFIVTHLLTASPAKRLSAWEALQHPWFKSRYHDPTSNRSTLSIAKQAMVRRRSSWVLQGSFEMLLITRLAGLSAKSKRLTVGDRVVAWDRATGAVALRDGAVLCIGSWRGKAPSEVRYRVAVLDAAAEEEPSPSAEAAAPPGWAQLESQVW